MPLPESVPTSTTQEKYDGLVSDEELFKNRFGSMSDEDFIGTLTSILLTITEDAPGLTHEKRKGVERMLMLAMNGEVPEDIFGAAYMMPRSVVAWVMCLREFVERVQKIDITQLPISAHVEVVSVEAEETDPQYVAE